MDHFDVSGPKLIPRREVSHLKFLVIAFQIRLALSAGTIEGDCPAAQDPSCARQVNCEIDAPYGHDSFLFEVDEQAHLGKNIS